MNTHTYSYDGTFSKLTFPEYQTANPEKVLTARGFVLLPCATTALSCYEAVSPSPFQFAVLIQHPQARYLILMQHMGAYLTFLRNFAALVSVFDRCLPTS
jgi:hypothetical protein